MSRGGWSTKYILGCYVNLVNKEKQWNTEVAGCNTFLLLFPSVITELTVSWYRLQKCDKSLFLVRYDGIKSDQGHSWYYRKLTRILARHTLGTSTKRIVTALAGKTWLIYQCRQHKVDGQVFLYLKFILLSISSGLLPSGRAKPGVIQTGLWLGWVIPGFFIPVSQRLPSSLSRALLWHMNNLRQTSLKVLVGPRT